MNKPTLLVVALLVVAGYAVGPATAQTDVTLTVSVVTTDDVPVGGATITATWENGSVTQPTAANGKAYVDVPAGADVELTVQHPAYVRNFPVTIEDATASDVNITLHDNASATVTVIDPEGEPVEGATVTFRQGIRTVTEVTTDDTGVARSGTIENGTYDISVQKSGYFTEELTTAISGETTHEISVKQGFVTFTATVKDDHFDPQKAIEGARVSVGETDTVTTKSDGVQKILVPVNTRLEVTVTKNGYESVRQSVRFLEEDKQVTFTIQRTPAISMTVGNERIVAGQKLRVEVTNEYGEPAYDVNILLDGASAARTDASGVATFVVEAAGEHEVKARLANQVSEPVTIEAFNASADTKTATATATTTATASATEEPTEVVTDMGTPTDEPSAFDTPGFGVVTALLAILVAALLFRRR